MLSLTADIGGYSKQVIQEDAIWYELNITFSISPPFMASMRCATYAILVECFRDSPRQCPVQYLHWSIKLFTIPLSISTLFDPGRYCIQDIVHRMCHIEPSSDIHSQDIVFIFVKDIVKYIFVAVLYMIK